MSYAKEGFTEAELSDIAKRKNNAGVGLRPSFINELPPENTGHGGADDDVLRQIGNRIPQGAVVMRETAPGEQRYTNTPMADALDKAFMAVLGVNMRNVR